MKKMVEVSGTAAVNDFMAALDHPYVAEVQALRMIIMGVHPAISEQIKWRAPSFSYKGYMATFNLWATQHVHLIFHNGAILSNTHGILEGAYPDRRMVYFKSMDDVREKRAPLEAAVREWMSLMDAGVPADVRPAQEEE